MIYECPEEKNSGYFYRAGVSEQVDDLDLKSSGGFPVQVQVLSPVLIL